MDLPKPFFEVVRAGDGVTMQVNATQISTIQETSTGTTLIVLSNGERIEAKAPKQSIEESVSSVLAND